MSTVPEIPPEQPTRRRNPIALAALAGVLLFAVGVTAGIVAGAGAGTYPDWVAATATIAAFSAAVVAARYAYGALKVEELREDRWLSTQRQAQASLVAAWPGALHVHYAGVDADGLSVAQGYDGLDVKLRKASDVPVTAVRVDAALVTAAKSDYPIRLDLGNREVAKVLEPADEPVTKRLTADAPIDPASYAPGNVELECWAEITIYFRDASGRQWERLPDGRLLLIAE